MAEGQQVPLDPRKDWNKDRNRETASRAVREYLDTLNEAAFGAASGVTPKFGSPSDPAVQCTVGRMAFLEEGERPSGTCRSWTRKGTRSRFSLPRDLVDCQSAGIED
jgi:hypothetical protein